MSLMNLPKPPPGKKGWPWDEISEPLPGATPGGSPWPKISVVTPSFNQGQFIEETIRSVLLQGYPSLEFIIIDGGSTDNTIEIIKKYEPWIAYWVSEPDRGQSHAINKGIKKTSGDIVFWLNSDDLVHPGAFDIIARKFMEITDAVMVIGQATIIDNDKNIVGMMPSYFVDWEEAATNPRNSIRQIAAFFRKSLFDELGHVEEDLIMAMDAELLVRFTKKYPPTIINDILASYRKHVETKTASFLLKGYMEIDSIRPSILDTSHQRSRFFERSANNWLSLSEMKDFSLRTRTSCLIRSIVVKPSVILKRRFWSSLLGLVRQKSLRA